MLPTANWMRRTAAVWSNSSMKHACADRKKEMHGHMHASTWWETLSNFLPYIRAGGNALRCMNLTVGVRFRLQMLNESDRKSSLAYLFFPLQCLKTFSMLSFSLNILNAFFPLSVKFVFSFQYGVTEMCFLISYTFQYASWSQVQT